MIKRSANAEWKGLLLDGKGGVALQSGAFEGQYSFQSRFEEGKGTNPEELMAASHAGCYSMALSFGIESAGFKPESVKTKAIVSLDKTEAGFEIAGIELVNETKVEGLDEAQFMEIANGAKENCPISKALASVKITLNAKLIK